VPHRLLGLSVPFFLLSSFCFAAEPSPAKNVLVLYSFTARGTLSAPDPLKSNMRSRVRTPVHFDVEYLESQHFGVAGYEESVSEMLGHAYGGKSSIWWLRMHIRRFALP